MRAAVESRAGAGCATAIRCGELAVERGHIDRDTRDHLRALQRQTFEPLGERLVETGALAREQMTELREAYSKSQETKSAAAERDHAA